MISAACWEWFGWPGHFCGAADCRFHLHTHINGWCVSTVGDYWPSYHEGSEPEWIGHGRKYETMVFPLDKDGNIVDHREHRFDTYVSREEANAGHLAMCLEVAERPPSRIFTCAECFMRRGDCDCPDATKEAS